MRVVALVGTALVAVACESPRRYVHVAEGLSSVSAGARVEVASRMFSAPELEERCRVPVKAMQLVVRPSQLELAQGDVYPLDSLSVVAVDEAGVIVPRVPIAVEVEDVDPALVRLRSDDPDLLQGRVRVIGRGELEIRVRTICGTRDRTATTRLVAR